MTKQDIKEKKPSQRIEELATEQWQNGIDSGFSQGPDMSDYIIAIVKYLDEKHE